MAEMPYQVNLRLLQERADDSAKSLFSRLDKSLAPSVFFVAIFPNLLVGESKDNAQALEDYVRIFGNPDKKTISDAFSLFRREINQIEPLIAQQEIPKLKIPIDCHAYPFHKGKAIGIAIESSLNQASKKTDKRHFAGEAVWREEDHHFVCPVLCLNRKEYKNHYALINPIHILNPHSTSLLNLVIIRFLQACKLAIKDKAADVEFEHVPKSIRNILPDAARSVLLLWNVATTVNLNTDNLNPFEAYNSIASLPYEKREGNGQVLISEEDHDNIEVLVRFTQPIQISNHRLVRKMLEITGANTYLLCNRNSIYGLGTVRGTYDIARENLFRVEFVGLNLWRLWHDKNEMMTVELGQPRLPAKQLSENEFKTKFRAQFGRAGSPKHIYEIVDAATKQTHGALIIVAKKASSEATRFFGQCVQVKPFSVTPDSIVQLTAIDGAILIDPEGKCFALGAILDGEAAGTGNPARGSRYNSAHRYIYSRRDIKKEKCMAVIISTDGMVDVI